MVSGIDRALKMCFSIIHDLYFKKAFKVKLEIKFVNKYDFNNQSSKNNEASNQEKINFFFQNDIYFNINHFKNFKNTLFSFNCFN